MNERDFLREAGSDKGLTRQSGKHADFHAALALRDRLLAEGFVRNTMQDHRVSTGGGQLDLFSVVLTDAGRSRLRELGG